MTSIMQLVLFTLGLLLFGFGLFVGVYPQGDQTVGLLLMWGGLAQIIYSLGVGDDRWTSYSKDIQNLRQVRTKNINTWKSFRKPC